MQGQFTGLTDKPICKPLPPTPKRVGKPGPDFHKVLNTIQYVENFIIIFILLFPVLLVQAESKLFGIEDTSLQEKKKILQMNKEALPRDEFSTNYLTQEDLKKMKLEENNIEQNTLVTNEKKGSKLSTPSCERVKSDSCKKKYFVEFKPAYFLYQDRVARSIFGHGGYMSIFELDVKANKYFHTWIDVGLLFDSGKVKSVNSNEQLTLIPVSLGLKHQCKITNKASLYAKIGPNWTYASTKTDYLYVQSKVCKNNFGALVGIGSLVSLGNHFSLDFFFDYIYNKKKFTDSNSNLRIKTYFGGFAVGAGLGYSY